MQEFDLEKEKKEILVAYKGLLEAAKYSKKDPETIKQIRRAFDVALEAHKDMRRKSGEPYIYHPIAVARICAEEMGLGEVSIICALLHDTVEDTDITLEDISSMFGDTVCQIIDGLTKISGVVDQNISLQAENFRKILLTLSDDVRVILIKLADRLHNMRTLGSMRRDKQLKIASETLFLYAPMAHRLGLHSIKSELEDLSLKFKEPDSFHSITDNLKVTEEEREKFINHFSAPINNKLEEKKYKYELKGRTKSVFSIWNKMNKKQVPFEEVYDVFAIRIILDVPKEDEKAAIWHVYSIVTDFYQPNLDRLRDWISIPKSNGYEALHTTVMSGIGKWVEVQIRSKRMDEIAEMGYAAHWRYKEGGKESKLDKWLDQVRELLKNQEDNALDFIDSFKLNLNADDIYVFTPKGEMKTLPQGASALDFAFSIHTGVGINCLGAKVNNKLVALSHKLKSGDQVQILTSQKQKPKESWLHFVITHRAKTKIKSHLNELKRELAQEGKLLLEKEFKRLKIEYDNISLKELQKFFKVPSSLDLYYKIAKKEINLKLLKGFEVRSGVLKPKSDITKRVKGYFDQFISKKEEGKKNLLVIGDDQQRLDYKLAPCCNPISGDEVFGFTTINDGIKIHKTSCPNAVQLMSNYAYRIVKAKWTANEQISFLAGILINGIDEVGVVNNITKIISSEESVNMRSISFDSHDGIFEGIVMLYVFDTKHLVRLMKKLNSLEHVTNVKRIN